MAITSTSRFTGSPTSFEPSTVTLDVVGISPTLNDSSSTAITVSDTPSTVIEPFSTTYRARSAGSEKRTTSQSAAGSRAQTELVKDGDFESGDFIGDDWSQKPLISTLVCSDDCHFPPPSGTRAARLGAIGGDDDWIWQEIDVPSGVTAAIFEFRYAFAAEEFGVGEEFDNHLYALICDAAGAIVSGL